MFEDQYFEMSLRGERVNSYSEPMKPEKQQELSEIEKKILECIPRYPNTISLQDLTVKTNISTSLLSSKLCNGILVNQYPICDITTNQWCLIPREALG